LDLRRLNDGQVGRLGAVQNTRGVNAGLPVHVGDVRTVAHQAAGHRELAERVGRRKRVARGQRHDLLAAAGEEWIGGYEERVGAHLLDRGEYRVDLALGPRI